MDINKWERKWKEEERKKALWLNKQANQKAAAGPLDCDQMVAYATISWDCTKLKDECGWMSASGPMWERQQHLPNLVTNPF